MSKPRRRGRHPVLDDDDPLSSMVNLFDLAIVFAVGLIVALAAALRGGQLRTAEGKPPIELQIPEGQRLVRYRATEEKGKGAGSRIGTTFRLPNGDVVYVPDPGAEGSGQDPPPSKR